MSVFRTCVVCMMLAIGAAGFSGCALKRDVDDLEQRIQNMEHENRVLQQRVSKIDDALISGRQSETGIRELYAGQYAEIEQIREELRRLNGQVDESSYRMSEEIQSAGGIAQHARDAAALNDKRVRRIERYLGFDAGESPEAAAEAPAAAGAPLPAAAALSESQVYEAAKKMYDDGDWDAAFRGFEAFLKQFPKSNLADNARFWIGEIYYNQGLFKQAIIEYQTVIETYPNGNKVAAAYLKQGISFNSLGENANARLAMQELIRRFPDSNEAGIARQYMSRLQ